LNVLHIKSVQIQVLQVWIILLAAVNSSKKLFQSFY